MTKPQSGSTQLQQVPYIPRQSQFPRQVNRAPSPKQAQPASGQQTPNLSVFPLTKLMVGGAISSAPRMITSIGARIGVAVATNAVLHSLDPWRFGAFLKAIISILVFLTASYNPIVPKALFWVLVMTVGVKLFHRIKLNGLVNTFNELKQFGPAVVDAWARLGKLAVPLLVMGGGLGFILANILSRNNRFDKMLVCYILGFSLIDSLTRGHKSMVFLYLQALMNDVSRIAKKPSIKILPHTYILTGGVAAGLYLNTIFSLSRTDNGGYVLGLVLFGASVAYAIYITTQSSQSVEA